jgi:excisionase family DNA binding protein
MSAPAERKSASQLARANWPKDKKRVPAAETLLTVSQVADNWQVSRRTVRRVIKAGRLRFVRVGRSIRILRNVLDMIGIHLEAIRLIILIKISTVIVITLFKQAGSVP